MHFRFCLPRRPEKGPLTRIRAPQCTYSRHRNGRRPAQPTGQVPVQRPSAEVEHVGKHPERASGVPTVGHVGELWDKVKVDSVSQR